MADNYTPRMRKLYDDQIVKAMTEKFGYKNAMEVPKIEKITLNMG
ncbi:MAG: 50S ribosomal protein L5, partial [Sphingopyxis terrae]